MEITQELLDELGSKICSLYKTSEFLKLVKCTSEGGFYVEELNCYNKNHKLNFLNTVLPILANNISTIYSEYNEFFSNDFRFTDLDAILQNLNCICDALTNINDIIVNKFPDLTDTIGILNNVDNNVNDINNNTNYDLVGLLTQIRDKFVENNVVSALPLSGYTFDSNNLEGSVLPGEDATVVDGTDSIGLVPITSVSTQVPNFDYNSLPGSQRTFENGELRTYREPIVDNTYIIDADAINGQFTQLSRADTAVYRPIPPVNNGTSIQEFHFTTQNVEIDWYFERFYPLTFSSHTLFFGLNGCNQNLVFVLKDGTMTDSNNQSLNINSIKNNIGFCRLGLIPVRQGFGFAGNPNTPYEIV